MNIKVEVWVFVALFGFKYSSLLLLHKKEEVSGDMDFSMDSHWIKKTSKFDQITR